jgi:hypothetical protein
MVYIQLYTSCSHGIIETSTVLVDKNIKVSLDNKDLSTLSTVPMMTMKYLNINKG